MPHRPPLKAPAAAQYLGITERQLRDLTARRDIPFHRVGRFKMYDPDDLDRFFNENRVEPV